MRNEHLVPEAKLLKGTFQGTGSTSAMAVDSANNRVFYAFSNGSNVVVNAYDTNTFLLVGSVVLPGANGSPINLVRWGVNGLAFNTAPSFISNSSAVFLLQTKLVTDAGTVPTGVQFELGTQSAFEGGQSALVKVIRTGDISGATSISYATADGTQVTTTGPKIHWQPAAIIENLVSRAGLEPATR